MNGWGTYLINNYKSTKDNYFWQEFSRDTHGLNLLVAVNIFKSYHLCLTVHLFTEWDPHFWGLTRVATGYCNCYEQKNKEHRFINELKMKVIFSFLLRESLIHRLISSRSEMVEGWEKVPCIEGFHSQPQYPRIKLAPLLTSRFRKCVPVFFWRKQ